MRQIIGLTNVVQPDDAERQVRAAVANYFATAFIILASCLLAFAMGNFMVLVAGLGCILFIRMLGVAMLGVVALFGVFLFVAFLAFVFWSDSRASRNYSQGSSQGFKIVGVRPVAAP